jgi:hypothetical protein
MFPLKSLFRTWKICYYDSFHKEGVDLLSLLEEWTILMLVMSLVEVLSSALWDHGLNL